VGPIFYERPIDSVIPMGRIEDGREIRVDLRYKTCRGPSRKKGEEREESSRNPTI